MNTAQTMLKESREAPKIKHFIQGKRRVMITPSRKIAMKKVRISTSLRANVDSSRKEVDIGVKRNRGRVKGTNSVLN